MQLPQAVLDNNQPEGYLLGYPQYFFQFLLYGFTMWRDTVNEEPAQLLFKYLLPDDYSTRLCSTEQYIAL